MDRPYSRYSATTTPSRGPYGDRRTGGYTDVETAGVDGGRAGYRRGTEYRSDYRSTDYRSTYDTQNYGGAPSYGSPYDARPDDDVQDYDEYEDIHEYYDPIDRRWIWVAGVAGAILLIAVICTVVILGGGDSGAVSKTVSPLAPTTGVATSSAPSVVAAPPPSFAPAAPLSPETVTTVAPSPTASAVPAPVPAPAPVGVAPSPRDVTYQVTGTRQFLDLVTVVYTDQQGALQTEFNVALPWSRTVTLDPGVELSSVTATSLTGQLNCAITDAAGATLVAQANNSMFATCTR